MKARLTVLVLISTILFLNISPNYFPCVSVLSKQTQSKRVPSGALFFYLNSSNPTENFTLTQFILDQSFVGQYNIQVECLLWLGSHDPVCEVICRNLLNPLDLPKSKSTDDAIDSKYTYFFSRPTVADPVFAVRLELHSEATITTPVTGWIHLSVVESTAPVSFSSIFVFVFSLSFILLWRKRACSN
ncbi:MAG: hypothetical protein ACFFBD_04475 [Candidatus Hodarchaeota archaeon]